MFKDRYWNLWIDRVILLICSVILLSWHIFKPDISYAALVGLLAAVVCVLTLVDPLRCLFLLLVSIVFEVSGDLFGTFTVSSTEVILAVFLATWLVVIILRRQVHDNRVPLAGWILLFVAVLVATLTTAVDKAGTIKHIFRWLELFVAMILVVNVVRGRNLLRFWNAFLFAVYAGALIAILQSFIPRFISIFPPPAAHEPAVIFKSLVRVHGSFEFPNLLAAFLNLGLFLSLGGILHGYKRRVEWVFHLVGLALIILALVLTYSRGGWLSAFVALLFLFTLALVRGWWQRRRLVIIGLVVLALLVVAIPLTPVLFPGVYQRVTSVGELESEAPAVDRARNLQNGLRMVADRPLLGIGTLGSDHQVMQEVEAEYGIVDLSKNAWGYTFILYLQIAVEYGLLGLLTFLLFIVMVYRSLFGALRRDSASPLVGGVLSALTVFLLHGFFEVMMFRSMLVVLGIVLGMGFALCKRGEDGWGYPGED